MPSLIFNQKSRIRQVIFEVREGKLLLSSRVLSGPFSEHNISLNQLSPDYKPGIRRNYALVIFPLVLAFICVATMWGLMNQSAFYEVVGPGLYLYPVGAVIALLFAAVRGSRRIEYYQFYTTADQPAFSIVREREQAQECAAFITALVAQIEFAKAGVIPDTAITKSIRVEQDAGQLADASPRRDLWQMSIACGMLAAGVPWLPNIHSHLGGLLIPLVILLCAGGATLSVFSLLGKESGRWWSIIGLVLSLIPPFFYM